MSAWQVLFEWPTGSVWGNWVDDIVCLVIGYFAGHVLHRAIKQHITAELAKVHERLDAHHELLKKVHENTRD